MKTLSNFLGFLEFFAKQHRTILGTAKRKQSLKNKIFVVLEDYSRFKGEEVQSPRGEEDYLVVKLLRKVDEQTRFIS